MSNRCNDAVDESPSDTPRVASGDTPDRRCRRCGLAALADENRCRECRSFLPGNQLGLTHGGRRRTLANPRELELWHAYARDLGGEDELTAGQSAILARVVEADAIAQTAYSYLASTDKTAVHAKVQKVAQVLLSAASTVYRGAALLGLERRAKTGTLAEYISKREETS